MTPVELVADCHRQMMAPVIQTKFSLDQLPSIFELEDELRLTKAHKATGFDQVPSAVYRDAATPLATLYFGLLVEIWTWRQEPVGHKGGHLTVLPKKLQATLPEHYRGIMLLPSFAKRLHALVRRRVIAALRPLKAPGQIGGMPHQQVAFGSHAFRTCCKIYDGHGLSTGIVFIDLATAFHKLLREMVSGVADPHAAAFVVDDLAHQCFPRDILEAAMKEPSVLEQLGVPQHLLGPLQHLVLLERAEVTRPSGHDYEGRTPWQSSC